MVKLLTFLLLFGTNELERFTAKRSKGSSLV